MPTALPAAEARLSPRQVARFLWLCIRVRYLFRRMERASLRVSRLGVERAGGRLLYFAERWAACHEEAAELLQCPLPPEVEEMRRLFDGADIAPGVYWQRQGKRNRFASECWPSRNRATMH